MLGSQQVLQWALERALALEPGSLLAWGLGSQGSASGQERESGKLRDGGACAYASYPCACSLRGQTKS